MFHKTLAAMLIVGLATVPALAQDDMDVYGPQAGDWEITLSGTGSSDKDFDSGAGGFSGSLGYYLTDSWEVAIRQSLGFADSNAGSSWTGQTSAAIDYVFDFDRWRPFIGANLGVLYGDDVDESFIGGLEAGVKYYVKPETFIYLGAGYAWIFDSADDVDSTFDDGTWNYNLGVGFNF